MPHIYMLLASYIGGEGSFFLASMDRPIMASPLLPLLLLLASFAVQPLALAAHTPKPPTARITVVGAVYCDTCSTSTFSRSSYFLPGANVLIKCKFRGKSAKATEQVNFEVNRTTDKYGVYKLEIPSVDGVNCMDSMAMKSMCQATLIGGSSSACNVPGLRVTADQISVKSKQDNLCIYSMNALSFRPLKKNATLCGNRKEELELGQLAMQSSFNSSKFFLPYGFPLPFPFPIPWPQLPPFSSLSFPSLPPPPFPIQTPPSLPFPFPRLPPFPPSPNPFPSSPPPAFNLGDPRTWIPYIPSFFPPSPPPPRFNLRDPKTWIPHIPPSPPSGNPQSQKP